IERMLHRFDLHCGLTYLDNEPLQRVRTLPLYHERYLLLSADCDGDSVTWAEAAGTPLCLLSPDMQNRRIIDSIFLEAVLTPRPVIETNSISTLYSHVREGSLSAVVAHAWLHQHGLPSGMRAVPLVEPQRTHQIGLVFLDRDPEPLLARALI